MSSNKGTDTKIQDDHNTDSGFLSGPLSEDMISTECDIEEGKDKIEVSDPVQLDSGLDLSSEYLSSASLSATQLENTPSITLYQESSEEQKIPPIAILFQQDEDGDTQLHIAAIHGCEKSISTLIRLCPDKALLDIPNDCGQTALHIAAMSNKAIIARMLVRAGASIGLRDYTGATPVHRAAALGYSQCLQALLTPVTDRPHRKLATVLNQKNYEGQTCVHVAASAGHLEALHTLTYYGADINATEGLCGWTPLHIAAVSGDVETAQYLIEKCPGVVVRARDFGGRTPASYALRTKAAPAFTNLEDSDYMDDSGSDSETDDEFFNISKQSDQKMFERIREGITAINVS